LPQGGLTRKLIQTQSVITYASLRNSLRAPNKTQAELEAKLMDRQYSQAPLDETGPAPRPLPDSAHSTPVARE